jgi:hypothetical protein
MKVLLSLPLLQHYSDSNGNVDYEDPPLRHNMSYYKIGSHPSSSV